MVEYKGYKSDLTDDVSNALGFYVYAGAWFNLYTGTYEPAYQLTHNNQFESDFTDTTKKTNSAYVLYYGHPTYRWFIVFKFLSELTFTTTFVKSEECKTTHFEDCPGKWKIKTKYDWPDELSWDNENVVVRCGKVRLTHFDVSTYDVT